MVAWKPKRNDTGRVGGKKSERGKIVRKESSDHSKSPDSPHSKTLMCISVLDLVKR